MTAFQPKYEQKIIYIWPDNNFEVMKSKKMDSKVLNISRKLT